MSPVVYLLDVDNTLLDNDRFNVDSAREIIGLLGAPRAREFHELYERTREELGHVDYPEVLRRFRHARPEEPRFTELVALVLGHGFAEYVYPDALPAIGELSHRGIAVILSDGDFIYQAAKVGRSGLARAVDGRVLIYTHKEKHLDQVAARFPADRYVLVDDKRRILAEVKRRWGDRVTTVHVPRGKYAEESFDGPAPDRVIVDLRELAA